MKDAKNQLSAGNVTSHGVSTTVYKHNQQYQPTSHIMKVVLMHLCLLTATVNTFTLQQPIASKLNGGAINKRGVSARRVLFSSPIDDEAETASMETSASSPAPTEPEGTSYPINAPSPILLSASMLLAIVGTGKLLE